MCLSMIPFAAIMVALETINGNAKFEFNIIPIGLLILAMFLRYNKQHAVQGSLKYLNPYEVSTYMSLGVILAFIVDSVLGIKELQKDLIVRILCEVALGYVAHYMLKHWSNAVYILLLNLFLTLMFSRGYNFKYHKAHKNIIKWVFLQQSFGFFTIYLGNYLSSNSVTLYQYVRPVGIVFTIFVAILLKNIDRKPKLKDFFAVCLVALGIYLINTNI